MKIFRRGIAAGLVLGVMVLGAGVTSAGAAYTVQAETECCSFAPGPYYFNLGEIATFGNPVGADAPHNLTATATGPDGAALFRSNTIAAGSTSAVEGTQYLEGGDYPFYCTLHGLSMSGELTIDGGKGEIVPRPSVKVAIPGQRLKKVGKSGRLKVRVKAATESSNVKLKVKLGKKRIGSATRISLSGGATKTVRVKLTTAGRKAMAKRRKAAVSVKSTVAFGSPSSAKKALR